MKKLLLSTLFLAMTLTISAIPAKREWRTFKQADGSTVTLMLVGDENFHCFQTTDGLPVVEVEGNYYYANSRGEMMQPTDMLAHNVEMRTTEETAAIAAIGSNNEDINRMWRSAPNKQHIRHKTIGEPTPGLRGSKKGLVILVSFSDLEYQIANPRQTFDDLVNKEGYTNNSGAIGSVHDYFKDQSNGVFDLTFDVVGPYQAPESYAYYGKDQGSYTDVNVRELIKFAFRAADDDVNYKNYDWNGNGEVDQVMIIYAGYSQAQGGASNTIWPHESQLMNEAFRLDGVKLNTYACGPELEGNSGTRVAGIGTICHEFTHCLGLPDFYDTTANSGNGNTNLGMGSWDVMCNGSYNGNSWTPAGYTAYERNFCGWLNYKELKNPCKVTNMKPLQSGGDAYVMYNPNHRDEYYLMENRYRTRWDKGVPANGLLIYHVNYVANRWRQNTVNTTGKGNPCMHVVPADNSASLYSENTDVYPYKKIGSSDSNDSFGENTTPAATLDNRNTDNSRVLHVSVTNIAKSGSNISFIFNDGTEEWSDPNWVSGIEEFGIRQYDAKNNEVGIYSMNGVKVSNTTSIDNLTRGLYIVKYTDGSTKKLNIK